MSTLTESSAEHLLGAAPESDKGKTAQKLEFVQLRAAGLSLGKIAGRLKVSKTTLSNWQTELAADIRSVQSEVLDELRETYRVCKAGRVAALGTVLDRLKQEAETRDLSAVPVEKILDLMLKYQGELKAEVGDEPVLWEASGRDGTGPKVDGHGVTAHLRNLLARSQAGQLSPEQARQELAIAELMLKTAGAAAERAMEAAGAYSDRVVGEFLMRFFREFIPRLKDCYMKSCPTGDVNEFLDRLNKARMGIDLKRIQDEAYAEAASGADAHGAGRSLTAV